ncbi:VHL beta domain-containing protein [Catenulispora rubra]|uniref:VHL beta domain-containing protein n=1 Tax=Catenulispora rubra TaxID=280293 RepID=UPI0018928050|nr:hypothetical protein [Catenulispora rubra]
MHLRQAYADQVGLGGDPDSAERLYEVIVRDCLRHLGPTHATTATARQGQDHWQRTAHESPVVYPSVAAPQTPSSTWPTLDALPPSAAKQLMAQPSRQSTYVEFDNVSGKVLHVCWIDFNGHPQLYKVLNPNQKYVQQTYVGHPWASIEPDGTIHAVFQPSDASARAVLR